MHRSRNKMISIARHIVLAMILLLTGLLIIKTFDDKLSSSIQQKQRVTIESIEYHMPAYYQENLTGDGLSDHVEPIPVIDSSL